MTLPVPGGKVSNFIMSLSPAQSLADTPPIAANPSATGAGEFDLRAMLRTVLQYKWVVVLATLIVAAGVTLWTLRQPKVFEAVTTIEYDPNPIRPLGNEVEDVADPIGSFWSAREYFETQNRIIASRAVAEKVVDTLGLHKDPDFFEVSASDFEERTVTQAAKVLISRLDVEPIQDTRLVEIHVRDRNPERAMLVANTIADEYIKKTQVDRRGSSENAREWLGQQLDKLRSKLNDSELVLHEFKEQHNVLSVSMEDRQNLVASEIQAFNEALTDVRQRRIQLAARARRLRAASESDPLAVDAPVLDNNAAIVSLRQGLREKLAEKERLSARYGDAHPQMVALSQETSELRAQLMSEIALVLSSAEADLDEAQSIESGLRAAVGQANDAGLRLNLREIEYQRLNRERENNAKIYEVVLARTAETNLTHVMQPQHVRVVDRALEPTAAVSPNVPLNVALGVLMGLLLGVSVAASLHFMDRRLRTAADVEHMGVTTIGVVPSILLDPTPKKDGGKRGRRPLKPDDNFDIVTYTHPMSSVAECFRAIRTNLMFMSPNEPIRSLVVTSPTPREGKTTVACNVAVTLAQSGKRVLLVDTDLRRPRVHKSFDVDTALGATSVIVGAASLADAAQRTQVEGLDVLPCGPVPPNPSELLHGQGFNDLLSAALSQYDRVIFDSPPLGAVTDAAVLAPQLDGVMVVVKADQTTRDGLRHALRQLYSVSARLLGVVLNDVDLTKNVYGGDGYYQYYRYHYYSDEAEPEDTVEAAE